MSETCIGEEDLLRRVGDALRAHGFDAEVAAPIARTFLLAAP